MAQRRFQSISVYGNIIPWSNRPFCNDCHGKEATLTQSKCPSGLLMSLTGVRIWAGILESYYIKDRRKLWWNSSMQYIKYTYLHFVFLPTDNWQINKEIATFRFHLRTETYEYQCSCNIKLVNCTILTKYNSNTISSAGYLVV